MKRISFVWLAPTLTAIGKKFGIDAHYFAKNSALVIVGHFVSVLRGIVTGYFVARFFSQEIYGEYQFILSILGMMSLFTFPGLAQSITRAWSRDDAFSLKKITKYQFNVCLVGSIILLGVIPFLQYYDRQELWPLFLAGALLFPLPPIATVHFGGATIGRARFDTILKANILWSTLIIIATLGIIFFHQSALLMLIATMAVSSVVHLVLVHWYCRGSLLPQEEEGDKNTKAIIRYGWQLTVSTLPVNLVWYIDKLMISQMFGLNQLAAFSVALLIPEQVKTFAKQLLPVSFSRQAKGDDSRQRRRKLTKAVLAGTAVFAVGIALYIALAPWLMPLLFPNYEADQIVFLTSVAAVTLIVTPGTLFAQYLEAQGMIREIQWSHWTAAALFGVALVVLIPMYGLLGAVLARGIFRFSYLGLSWWFVMTSPVRPASTS